MDSTLRDMLQDLTFLSVPSSADVHRDPLGVSQPIQRVRYLQQEANGHIHGCELLRAAASYVS